MAVEVAMKQLWIWNQKTCSLNEMVSPFITGCGGMLNGTSGTFRSPGYLTQLKYDDNLDCSWTLLIPSDGYLTLIFVEFETEEWWVKIYQPSTCNLPSPLVNCVHPLLCAPTVTFLFPQLVLTKTNCFLPHSSFVWNVFADECVSSWLTQMSIVQNTSSILPHWDLVRMLHHSRHGICRAFEWNIPWRFG